jgi:tetratricopeptide (TPR) repeat protein
MMQTRRFLLVVTLVGATACGRSPSKSFDRGVELYQAEKYAPAADCFENAIQNATPTAQAWNFLGVCRLNTSNTDNAIVAFQKAIELDAAYPAARYNLGVAYLEASRPEEAVGPLRWLAQSSQCPPSVYYQLGRAYLKSGAWNSARQTFEKFAEADNNADIQNDLGIIETHLGNFKTAKAHFDAAVRLDPGLAAGYLNLAILEHRYLGQKQLALQYYQKLLDLLPTSELRESIRDAVEKLKQETAVRAKPADVVVTNTAARTSEPAHEVVAVELPKPEPLAPPVPTAPVAPPPPSPKHRIPVIVPTLKAGNKTTASRYFNEGILMQKQAKIPTAIGLYGKAIAADPTFSQAYYNLAIACQESRQTEKALDNYEYAIALNPDFSEARLNYGILLQDEGYIADALVQYEKYLDRNPTDSRIQFTVGTLYSHDPATRDKARQHYLAFLKLAPNAPSNHEVRDWLTNNP